MSRAFILLGAFLLDIIAKEPSNTFHPVAWMGTFISCVWNRRFSSNRVVLFFFGTIMTLIGTVLFALVPFLLLRVAARLHVFRWGVILIGIVLLKPVFSLGKLLSVAREIQESLYNGELEKARELTSLHLVSRPTSALDEAGISAAVIESVAENLTDSFTAPLFYFCLGGLPAAWGYRYVNTSDAMVGYPTGDFAWGGKFAARTDDLLNYLPARLTSVFLILTAFLSGNGCSGLVSGTLQERRVTESPNAGWTMAATALVLGVRLEKADHYVINPEGKNPRAGDIGSAVRFVRNSAILVFVVLLGGTILFRGLLYG